MLAEEFIVPTKDEFEQEIADLKANSFYAGYLEALAWVAKENPGNELLLHKIQKQVIAKAAERSING